MPRKQFALAGVEQRVVPQQQIDLRVQAGCATSSVEKFRQRAPAIRRPARLRIADQPHPAVDVPAEHEDAVARALRNACRTASKNAGAVDQRSGARGAFSMRQTFQLWLKNLQGPFPC